MVMGKAAYLEEITNHMDMRSIDVGEELDGTSPPSVFIGSWNYPDVFAGPMLTGLKGDTSVMDQPESWIPGNRTQEDIIKYRLSLVRGKHRIKVDNFRSKLVDTLQEIALSEDSVESEAKFKKAPRGFSLKGDNSAYGPSGDLAKLNIGNTKWNRGLEKVFYDTDMKAKDAVVDLHKKGTPFSSIQKAFSTGTMGVGKRRKLVPTRWSITAVDSTIGNDLLDNVKHYPLLDTYQVHEFASLHNYYTVILMPTPWQYEWQEAFLKIKGDEEMLFSDWEPMTGKKGYSRVGGCFYSCRMAVLEELERQKKQAGAIILREARRGYVPLGVFNVRENVRNAMEQMPKDFDSLKDALWHVSKKLHLPMKRYVTQGDLLNEMLHRRQSRLDDFLKSEKPGYVS